MRSCPALLAKHTSHFCFQTSGNIQPRGARRNKIHENIGKEIDPIWPMTDQRMTSENRTITVLGMHRSGTSALIGSLEQAGLYIGNTNQHADDNIRGNRESTEIMTLHNDLLERNGGAWDKPIRKIQWDPIHRALQTTIINTFRDQPVWGFKDPRTLLTTDMWIKAIPHLELVGIYRHPFLVAQSLMTRNQKTEEQALDLWYAYNLNLQWLAQNKPAFPLIEFSTDSEDFKNQLKWLISVLKLDVTPGDFFDARLRKQTIPEFASTSIANRCMKLYESLTQLREQSKGLYDQTSNAA